MPKKFEQKGYRLVEVDKEPAPKEVKPKK